MAEARHGIRLAEPLNHWLRKAFDSAASLVALRSDTGLRWWARAMGAPAMGQAATLFVRPEAIEIARSAAELPAGMPAWGAEVRGVLFDGGNSTVQVVEAASRTPLSVALPLTGRLADLRPLKNTPGCPVAPQPGSSLHHRPRRCASQFGTHQ